MSRIDEDNTFIKGEAGWLPLEKSVVTVKECLLRFISSLAAATDYLLGKTEDSPEEQMSDLFAIVCNNKCRAFEELCDRVKECKPGSIPDEKVESIWRLGKILASRAEEVLPDDDVSCNDLRNAMTSLFTLASNTPSKMPVETYEAKVEETRKEIHLGFKSLSNGFRKFERRRKHGDAPAAGVLTQTDKAFIHEEVAAVSGKVETTAEEVNDRLDNQSARLKDAEHQIELARKGKGQLMKKTYPEKVQERAFRRWIEATVKYGEKHQKDDGLAYFASELEDDGIEDADEWKRVVEQYRKRKGLCIRDEVKKWDKTHTETSEWRGRRCA